MADGLFTREQINELADSLAKLLRSIASGEHPPPRGTHAKLIQAAEALDAILGTGRPAERPQEPVDEGPVRVTRMQLQRRGGAAGSEHEVHFTANLEPAPAREDRQWWMRHFVGQGGGVRGCAGPGDRFYLLVQAPIGELETVARQLVVAVEEANTAFEDYESDRRNREQRLAAEEAEHHHELVEQQALLDRVMADCRSDDGQDPAPEEEP